MTDYQLRKIKWNQTFRQSGQITAESVVSTVFLQNEHSTLWLSCIGKKMKWVWNKQVKLHYETSMSLKFRVLVYEFLRPGFAMAALILRDLPMKRSSFPYTTESGFHMLTTSSPSRLITFWARCLVTHRNWGISLRFLMFYWKNRKSETPISIVVISGVLLIANWLWLLFQRSRDT